MNTLPVLEAGVDPAPFKLYYRHIPGSLGFGTLNNGAVMSEEFETVESRDARAAELLADATVQWVSDSGPRWRE